MLNLKAKFVTLIKLKMRIRKKMNMKMKIWNKKMEILFKKKNKRKNLT